MNFFIVFSCCREQQFVFEPNLGQIFVTFIFTAVKIVLYENLWLFKSIVFFIDYIYVLLNNKYFRNWKKLIEFMNKSSLIIHEKRLPNRSDNFEYWEDLVIEFCFFSFSPSYDNLKNHRFSAFYFGYIKSNWLYLQAIKASKKEKVMRH